MLGNLKTLVVVLALGTFVLVLAKPLCLCFMAPEDYARRRNAWIALTVVAFLSPSFWLYAVVALAVCAWCARRDANPAAFYILMLHIIPPVGLYVPVVGINQLFLMNNYRLLSLAVLAPFALRMLMAPATEQPAPTVRKVADALIIGYLLLQLVLFMPYESLTNTMRRGFLFTLDSLLVYYVFSRACTTRRAINEVLATYCLACGIFALIAAFEAARGWLQYQGLGERWGVPLVFSYLMRGESLRAQASLGHSLTLGYVMAMGFGFSLYLGQLLQSKRLAWAVALWMWLGLLAAYSRGPWLVAVVTFFAFIGLQPGGITRFVKYGFLAVVGAGVVLVSPLGEKIIDVLPFVGTLDAGNVDYRRRLAELSWQLIQQNPWFGSPFVMSQMEELRQGQGIIDLVNSYAAVALIHGIVGLALFVGVFIAAMWGARRMAVSWAQADLGFSLLGTCLVACLLGTLLMMAVGSFGNGLAWTAWILAGLAVGYACASEEPGTSPLAPAWGPFSPMDDLPLGTGGWIRRNADGRLVRHS